MEGLDKVIVADKLDIAEIFVNQLTFPLALILLNWTTIVGINCLLIRLEIEEELIELLIYLDFKLNEIRANGASKARGHQ